MFESKKLQFPIYSSDCFIANDKGLKRRCLSYLYNYFVYVIVWYFPPTRGTNTTREIIAREATLYISKKCNKLVVVPSCYMYIPHITFRLNDIAVCGIWNSKKGLGILQVADFRELAKRTCWCLLCRLFPPHNSYQPTHKSMTSPPHQLLDSRND